SCQSQATRAMRHRTTPWHGMNGRQLFAVLNRRVVLARVGGVCGVDCEDNCGIVSGLEVTPRYIRVRGAQVTRHGAGFREEVIDMLWVLGTADDRALLARLFEKLRSLTIVSRGEIRPGTLRHVHSAIACVCRAGERCPCYRSRISRSPAQHLKLGEGTRWIRPVIGMSRQSHSLPELCLGLIIATGQLQEE